MNASSAAPFTALPFTFTAPLRTERLRLRLVGPDDVDDVFAYESRADVCRYLLMEPRTREQVVERVARHGAARTLAADGDYLQLAIELGAAAGARARVIGHLYFTIASIANSKGEIGWTLHPDYQGHGYAFEAANAMLELAFRQLELHRVVADLDPRNTASIALCRRIGMREEGLFVQDLWFKGGWGDSGVYAVLRDEWLGAHGPAARERPRFPPEREPGSYLVRGPNYFAVTVAPLSLLGDDSCATTLRRGLPDGA
jgi:RimJ/RimL family protein N-acetyltransferase